MSVCVRRVGRTLFETESSHTHVTHASRKKNYSTKQPCCWTRSRNPGHPPPQAAGDSPTSCVLGSQSGQPTQLRLGGGRQRDEAGRPHGRGQEGLRAEGHRQQAEQHRRRARHRRGPHRSWRGPRGPADATQPRRGNRPGTLGRDRQAVSWPRGAKSSAGNLPLTPPSRGCHRLIGWPVLGAGCQVLGHDTFLVKWTPVFCSCGGLESDLGCGNDNFVRCMFPRWLQTQFFPCMLKRLT